MYHPTSFKQNKGTGCWHRQTYWLTLYANERPTNKQTILVFLSSRPKSRLKNPSDLRKQYTPDDTGAALMSKPKFRSNLCRCAWIWSVFITSSESWVWVLMEPNYYTGIISGDASFCLWSRSSNNNSAIAVFIPRAALSLLITAVITVCITSGAAQKKGSGTNVGHWLPWTGLWEIWR